MGLHPFGRGLTGVYPRGLRPFGRGLTGVYPRGLLQFGRGLTGVYPRGLKIVDYFYQIKQIILQMVNGSVVIIVILKETICLD
jgi:hypothetical protein